MSTTNTAKKTLYAAVGVGSTALAKAREIPQRVISLPETLQSKGLTIDIRELPKTVKSLNVKPQAFFEQAKSLSENATKRATKAYELLSERGEKLVGQVRRSAPTKKASAQAKTAKSKVKAAATSVKKAAGATATAVESAADKASTPTA